MVISFDFNASKNQYGLNSETKSFIPLSTKILALCGLSLDYVIRLYVIRLLVVGLLSNGPICHWFIDPYPTYNLLIYHWPLLEEHT